MYCFRYQPTSFYLTRKFGSYLNDNVRTTYLYLIYDKWLIQIQLIKIVVKQNSSYTFDSNIIIFYFQILTPIAVPL